MNEKEIFRENIRYLREQHGMRIGQMAGILGISPATLRRLEAGKPVRLHAGHLIRVCDYFGVTSDAVLRWDLREIPARKSGIL